ncbi:MAG: glycosyltransferase family 39 protein, partial [Chloroflexota bacterium]
MRSRINKHPNLTIFLLAIFAYSIVAIAVTWPLAINFGSHLLGSSTDSLLHYWNGWWVKQALNDGQNPFYSPLIFYPKGISLVTHNIAWFNVLFWILFESIIGGIQAYNLSILFSLVLCGLAVFWLIYKMTDNQAAAFIAGLIYMAWPFRLTQLDHPNILATQWIPVFFLFLIYAIQKGRWRDALLAGFFFALVGYTRWQLLIAVTTMALIYFFFNWRFWLPTGQRYKLTRLAAGGALAIILLLPPAIMLANQLEIEGASVNLLREGEDTFMQTDVLAYFTPPGSNPLVGEVTGEFYDHYYQDRSPGRRFTAYIGLTALVLAIMGVKYQGRESLPWIMMAVILILLALGPLLRINGQFYERAPTLYRLLSPLGIFQLMRVPDRFNVFLAL